MNKKYVTSGKPKIGGAAFLAPEGTTPPTDAKTKLTDAFKEVGYSSDDGLTNEMSRDSEAIKAWGGDTVLQPQTEYTDTFSTTLIESLNVNTLKAVYGDTNVSGTLESGITIKANSQELPYGVWVFDQITNGGYLKRMVLPYAKITEIGEISYKDDEAVGYEVTITAFPDDDQNTHYEYIQAPTSGEAAGAKSVTPTEEVA